MLQGGWKLLHVVWEVNSPELEHCVCDQSHGHHGLVGVLVLELEVC